MYDIIKKTQIYENPSFNYMDCSKSILPELLVGSPFVRRKVREISPKWGGVFKLTAQISAQLVVILLQELDTFLAPFPLKNGGEGLQKFYLLK